jgi:hypothetical protein
VKALNNVCSTSGRGKAQAAISRLASCKLQADAAGSKQKKNTCVAEPVFLAVFSGKIEETKNERKLVIPV